MHLNITTPQYSQEVMDKIEPYLYEFTSQHRSAIKIFIKILNKLKHALQRYLIRIFIFLEEAYQLNMDWDLRKETSSTFRKQTQQYIL